MSGSATLYGSHNEASMMEKTKRIDWNVILGGVSTFFSVLFLFFSPGWAFILAASPYTTLILFIGLFICAGFRKKEWSKRIISVLIPILLLSFVTSLFDYKASKKEHDAIILADATESLVDALVFRDDIPDWEVKSLDDDELVCFTVPAKYKTTILDDISDPGYVGRMIQEMRNDGRLSDTDQQEIKITLPGTLIETSNRGKEIPVEFYVGYTDARSLKKNWRKTPVNVLPESAVSTIKGVRCFANGEYEKSRHMLEEASSQGNPVGTYYLARLIVMGYGEMPDSTLYSIKLKEAAEGGCRAARYEWAEGFLNGSHSSEIDRAKAEFYLKTASDLKTLRAPGIINESANSVKLLSDFYHQTRQPFKAYRATKDYLKSVDHAEIKYDYHLMNCLERHKFAQARTLVADGERDQKPVCFYVHGMMYLKGLGEKRDYEKAERYLRYAADSLHFRKAYLGMSSLCADSGRPGKEYWEMLYDVDFSDNIAE